MRRTLNPGALSTLASLVSGLLLRVSGFLLRVDAVADARHGVNDPRFAEAFTQRRDSDAHRVGERVGVLIPRAFQELFGLTTPPLAATRTSSTANCFLVSAT